MMTRIFIALSFFQLLFSSITAGQVLLKGPEGTLVLIYPEGRWERVPMLSLGVSLYELPPADVPMQVIWGQLLAAEHALTNENSLTLDLVKVRMQMATLESKMKEQKRTSNSDSKDSVEILGVQLRELRIQEKVLESEQQIARDWTLFLGRQILKPSSEWKKNVTQWANENAHRFEEPQYQLFQTNSGSIIKHPAVDPCILVNEQEKVNESRLASKPTRLFSFTDPSLTNLLVNREMLECFGNIEKSRAGVYHLNLEFIFAVNNTKQQFGDLPLGALVEFRLINGEKLRLFNKFESEPKWNENLKAYHMMGRYAIGARETKLLQQFEVLGVLVGWSKAVMEFEIYDLDFFKRHFSCLLSEY